MIEIALLGCTHIHTRNVAKRLQAHNDVRVRYVWDQQTARAAAHAQTLRAVVVTDLDRVWEDKAVSAAVVCSETVRHEPLVMAAVAARKHLVVEQPLGMGARPVLPVSPREAALRSAVMEALYKAAAEKSWRTVSALAD